MSNLYTNLAPVYEAMYKTFIDYDEEFLFYSKLLKQYKCTNLLEIGSGTGHLSGKFTASGFKYTGLDCSREMVSIALEKYPYCLFAEGDMRDFSLPEKVQSAIITGRTVSYLITNQDVFDCFTSVASNLELDGYLCFDFIDANRFIPSVAPGLKVIHEAEDKGKLYHRESLWSLNPAQSWTFDWQAIYYEKVGSELNHIGSDDSTIRAFTVNEIELFLRITGFEIMEIIDRPSYAFDTFVVVAKYKGF